VPSLQRIQSIRVLYHENFWLACTGVVLGITKSALSRFDQDKMAGHSCHINDIHGHRVVEVSPQIQRLFSNAPLLSLLVMDPCRDKHIRPTIGRFFSVQLMFLHRNTVC
jgi:hypothetical protein